MGLGILLILAIFLFFFFFFLKIEGSREEVKLQTASKSWLFFLTASFAHDRKKAEIELERRVKIRETGE
jgi:hypothetical protein